ncbi:U3 small nucleolar RNA-interacting protein 2 [Episyrphus balteatus]|uniref:U3 small nucleolar RNA-interacting protein 2 n=1 Tax=Episyrphus balteatus TaxID=286459 RepID=UPI002484EA0F|nr:U3 small nucleolar RNA-interacting protein 2 [Episyrphus balteatus]
MSSFFLKNKPKTSKKRKQVTPKSSKDPKQPKKSTHSKDDEEIDSDDAFDSAEGEGHANKNYVSDEEIPETAQDKRLRLAKKYLEEIEKEEQSRAEDKEVYDHVSHRLQEDYLESVGKLRRQIAASIVGYSKDKILKHKKQYLPVTALALSSDGKFLFTGAKTQYVIKWDLATLRPIGTFDVNPHTEDPDNGKSRRSHVIAICLSTDSKFLALAEGGNNIQIWCPKELKHLKTFKGHRDVVTALVFRKDTHDLYSGSKDRSVKIWSVDEMAYIESLFGHQAHVTGIDALSRERAITSGGIDCSLRIWKITEESQLIYNGHRGSIEGVKFINDENFVSCGNDGSLCLWSALKKKALVTQPTVHGLQTNGDANWISAMAVVVNADLIASGSCDGFIRLWQMSDNGRKLTQIHQIPVPGFINSLTFTPDGLTLIAAVGQEHRLGRWWRIKESKNQILIIDLKTNTS